jgi:YHS domain-containing protein
MTDAPEGERDQRGVESAPPARQGVSDDEVTPPPAGAEHPATGVSHQHRLDEDSILDAAHAAFGDGIQRAHTSAGGTTMAMVTDPVCGTKLDASQAEAQTIYQDQTFYFCSTDCRRTFEENPKEFVNAAAVSVNEPGDQRAGVQP